MVLDSRGSEGSAAARAMGFGTLFSALVMTLREDARVIAAAWYRIPEVLPFGELGAKMQELETAAHALAGQPFNLNSPKQIQEILFVKQGIKPVKKTPTGAPSTDEDALEQLAQDHPLPKLLLEYRGIAKLKSTYIDKLPRMVNPDTGRVHTNYAQAVAITGRLASNDPNLQNIPVRTAEGRRIREAFIAPPGSHIVSADYSQIELRIMAHISGDENLLRAFAAGEDIHRATAAEIFGRSLQEVSAEERRYAKAINFGLMYGMSAFGLARQLGIPVTTTLRIMSTLTLEGLVRKEDNRYELGPVLIQLGNASLAGTEIRAAALPVLGRHGFSATVYLPTAFIGETRRRFQGTECITWSEARALRAEGIELGAHTVTHPRLVELAEDACWRELVDARLEIESHTGGPVREFSYPYAFPSGRPDFVRRLCELLPAAGYAHCATTLIGRAPLGTVPLLLPRLPPPASPATPPATGEGSSRGPCPAQTRTGPRPMA